MSYKCMLVMVMGLVVVESGLKIRDGSRSTSSQIQTTAFQPQDPFTDQQVLPLLLSSTPTTSPRPAINRKKPIAGRVG